MFHKKLQNNKIKKFLWKDLPFHKCEFLINPSTFNPWLSASIFVPVIIWANCNRGSKPFQLTAHKSTFGS